MRASTIFCSAAFAAAASAQSSSIDPFPQNMYLTQTNSLGVVTGMPAVVTQIPSQPAVVTAIPSQPAVVTSQPLPANIPAVGPGVHTLVLAGTGSMFNQTRTVVVSANDSTTVEILPTPSGSAASGSMTTTGSGAMRPSGSQTGTGAAQQSTGAAVANVQLAAGSVFGFGAFVAAFL